MTDVPPDDAPTWSEYEADEVRDPAAQTPPADQLAWSEASVPDRMSPDHQTPGEPSWSDAPIPQPRVDLTTAMNWVEDASPSGCDRLAAPTPLRWEDDEREVVAGVAEPRLAWSEAVEPKVAEPEPEVAEPEPEVAEPEPEVAEPEPEVAEPEPQRELVSRGAAESRHPLRRPRNLPDTWSIPLEPKRR